MRSAVTVACVQAEPVILDRDATVEKLAQLAAEAARNGARLLVFPEAFIPAYPSSVWARALAGWAKIIVEQAGEYPEFFPCEVEFGIINGQPYADFVEVLPLAPGSYRPVGT